MVQARPRRAAKTPPPAEPGRLSRDDWALAALTEIGKLGHLAPSVEKLAQDLNVTKGSFYWHFKSREELVHAALTLWEKLATDDVIAELATVSHPRRRLRGLLELIFREPHHLAVEGAILAAVDDAKFGRHIRRVSKRRLDYVVAAYAESGMGKLQAEHWGMLTYSAFVGALHVMRMSASMHSAEELKRYARHLNHVLVPLEGG